MQIHPVPAAASPFPPRPDLTGREIEVLLCWIRHDSKTEVAKALFLSLGTVNTHLTRIRAKYTSVGRPAPTKAALVARALQDGLVDISEL
ncbi:response regulator transcription factor [Rhodococcus sp. SBT000017]|uniref:response regulator transcription factor n=2 Tax=unclassified Rhodococcus (in: high G+C Gram-positive bacteria) TaxID=192944 RepID=UPI00268074CA